MKARLFLITLLLSLTACMFSAQAQAANGTEEEAMASLMAGSGSSDVQRDCVLLLDASGSMSTEPMKAQKAAALKCCKAVLQANENQNGSNYVAVVAFSTSVREMCGFTNDINKLESAINSVTADGNTNTEAALTYARSLLSNRPASAKKIIVLCSDGIPYSGSTSESGPFTKEEHSYYLYANAAYNAAKSIPADYSIYTLGFFHSLSGTNLTFGQKVMKSLQTAGYYEVTDPDKLDIEFEQIGKKITAKQYTVTFYPNGGTVSPFSKTVTENETYGELPAPNRTGYSFSGWYTSTSGGTQIYSTTTVQLTSNQTLYAHWTPNTYKVSLNGNGGTAPSPSSFNVTYDSTYGSSLADPYERANYVFAGWYTSLSGGSRIYTTTTVRITGPQTLYAHWVEKGQQFTVSFNGNGGTVSQSSKLVTNGEPYGKLPSAEKAGYVQSGWFTSYNGGTPVYETDLVALSNDQVLYAQWNTTGNSYSLYLDANGGYFSSLSQTTYSKTVTNGETYGTLRTPDRTGYQFEGWYSEKTGGTEIKSTTIVSQSGSRTLYARWTPKQFTVSFDAQGGITDVSSKTVTYDGTYGPLPSPTQTNYTFLGWYTSEEGGTRIMQTTTVKKGTDHTLYAHWSRDNQYSVYFDANGGSVSPSSKYVIKDEEYGELPEPKRDGYTFDGWYSSRTDGTKVEETTIYTLARSQTLYAHWTVNQYTVTLDGNGGANPEPNQMEVTYDTAFGTLPEIPARTGYDSDGWWTEKTGGSAITETTVVKVTEDTVLYAHWIPRQYTVKLVSEGGVTLSPDKITVTYDAAWADLYTPDRTGYTFTGWFTEQDGGKEIHSDDTVDITEDATLYARWEEKTITIRLDPRGGRVSPDTLEFPWSRQPERFPEAERDGYDFDGWSLSTDEEEPILRLPDTESLTESTTLYARWSPKRFTVTLDANGGTPPVPASVTVTYLEPYSVLPVLKRSGFDFDGWYTSPNGGSPVTNEDTVRILEDQTLYAHWNPIAVTVTLDPGGGTVEPDSVVVYFNSPYGLPTPVRFGYAFNGWYTSSYGGRVVTEETVVDKPSNHTLYARWSPVEMTVTFDPGGGTQPEPESRTVRFGGSYGTLPTTERPGYSFEGWYDEREDGNRIYSSVTVQKETDHTVYAHWTPLSYRLLFDANGGYTSVYRKTVRFDEPFGELPVPSWKGRDFLGWYPLVEDGDAVSAESVLWEPGDLTLYAHWQAKTFTVRFDPQGGTTAEHERNVTYGQPYGELPAAELRGSVLEGWFTDPQYGVSVKADTVVYLEEDKTLYARWRHDNNMGTANFTVVNAQTMAPVEGAEITADGVSCTTDADGKGSLLLHVGKCSVTVSAPGCLVRNVTVKIAAGENQIPMIGVSDKPLYEVSVTSHEMTMEEIRQAGIDVNAAGNNHVVHYDLKLSYEPGIDWLSIAYYWNGDGVFFPGPIHVTPPPEDPEDPVGPTDPDRDSSRDSSRPHIAIWLNDTGGQSGGAGGCYFVSGSGSTESMCLYPVSENYFLIVHGDVRWLKEMFDIEMLVINNSMTDSMENLTAELSLPYGLSLADMMEGEQQLVHQLDDLSGGETASTHWYVRGDAAGSYRVSARLQGMMMPFEEEIDDLFVSENALQVWAGNALQLDFEVPGAVYEGEQAYINISLKNVSNQTLYNVQHTVRLNQEMQALYEDGTAVNHSAVSDWEPQFKDALAPGEALTVRLSADIFFHSDRIEQKLEKVITVVDQIEALSNSIDAVSTGLQAAEDFVAMMSNCSNAVDQFCESNASDSAKAALSRKLGNELSALEQSYGSSLGDIIDAAAVVTNSNIFEKLRALADHPENWFNEQGEHDLEELQAEVHEVSERIKRSAEIRDFNVYDAIRFTISQIPVQFLLEDAVMSVSGDSTTTIPYSITPTPVTPHYFGISNITRYLTNIVMVASEKEYQDKLDGESVEIVPGMPKIPLSLIKLIPGMQDPFHADQALQELKATQDEITRVKVVDTSGVTKTRVWMQPSGNGTAALQSASDDRGFSAPALSCDNASARMENGVLVFEGSGVISFTPHSGDNGILHIESSNGSLAEYAVHASAPHECTAGERHIVVCPGEAHDGFAVRRCNVCGDILEVELLTANDLCEYHRFGAWEVETNPQTGGETRSRVCSMCGFTEYQVTAGRQEQRKWYEPDELMVSGSEENGVVSLRLAGHMEEPVSILFVTAGYNRNGCMIKMNTVSAEIRDGSVLQTVYEISHSPDIAYVKAFVLDSQTLRPLRDYWELPL